MVNQSNENGAHAARKGPLTTEQVLIEEAHAIGTAHGQSLPSRLREPRGGGDDRKSDAQP